MSTAIIYRDAKGEWRWRLMAANGRIIADSGEGYDREDDCWDGLHLATDEPPALYQRSLTADEAPLMSVRMLALACDYCGAGANEPCVTKAGNPASNMHASRWYAVKDSESSTAS